MYEDNSPKHRTRLQNDLERIKKTCAKYLGKRIKWQPLSSFKQTHRWNYYHDRDRKIGWCLVPKVKFIIQDER